MSEQLAKSAAQQLAGISSQQMTPRERLESKKRRLEAELNNVNKALDVLTAHPDIEKMFELVRRAL